jgi:hypothetical protein
MDTCDYEQNIKTVVIKQTIYSTHKIHENLASIEEINQHKQAFQLLSNIITIITKKEGYHKFIGNFNLIHTENSFNKLISLITRTFELVQEYFQDLEKIKQIKNKKIFKKIYNQILNIFIQKVKDDSPLKNLLFINENAQLIKNSVPKQRNRIDCLDKRQINYPNTKSEKAEQFEKAEQIDCSKYILKLNGGRCAFDSVEHAFSCLSTYLENCIYTDMIIKKKSNKKLHNYTKKIYIYEVNEVSQLGTIRLPLDNNINIDIGLKIRFPNFDSKKEIFIMSDDSGIRHILCDGNPPAKYINGTYQNIFFKTIYPFYYKFINLIKNKIIQIVNLNFNNPECDLVTIPCCRISNGIQCDCLNLTLKHNVSGNKKVLCTKCNLDLCSGGCGRIYHGETDCSITFDKASEMFIHNTSKPCPRCFTNINKIDGCNHLICTVCNTHYCYSCGNEYKKNDKNKYEISEHYIDNQIGRANGAICKQF